MADKLVMRDQYFLITERDFKKQGIPRIAVKVHSDKSQWQMLKSGPVRKVEEIRWQNVQLHDKRFITNLLVTHESSARSS